MFSNAGRACFLFAVSLVVSFSLGGCSSTTPKPTNIHIYSEADAELNRDTSARPLSVVLYVYQLRDRQAFARLTFEDFLSGKTDAELLGDDLIGKTEHVMLPGGKTSLQSSLVGDANYIGLVAMYRMPAAQQWRYLIPAEQMRKKSFWTFSRQKNISVDLHDCYMTINGVELDLIPGQRSNSAPTCGPQTQSFASPSVAPNQTTPAASAPPNSSSSVQLPSLPSAQLPTATPSLPSLPPAQTLQIPATDQATTLLRGSTR